VELSILVAILVILLAMALPAYEDALLQARRVRAVADLRNLEKSVLAFEARTGALPATLDEAHPEVPLDPWGNPYFFLRFVLVKKQFPNGARTDKQLRPVNTRFDLYSSGEDGLTFPAFTAKASRDDIVRAADGAFFGLAEEY
jgi:general secretion pathway protein G